MIEAMAIADLVILVPIESAVDDEADVPSGGWGAQGDAAAGGEGHCRRCRASRCAGWRARRAGGQRSR